MLVNSSAINCSVLHSTLLEEVARLRRLCSQEQFESLQQRISQSESDYLQLQRQYTYLYTRQQNQQHAQSCLLRELEGDYKHLSNVKDSMIKQNKELVGSLNRLRLRFREQQRSNKLEEQRSKEYSKELQNIQEQLSRKQLLQEDTNQDLCKLSKQKVIKTRIVKDMQRKIQKLKEELTQSYNFKNSIRASSQLLQKDLSTFKEELRQIQAKNNQEFPQIQLLIDKQQEKEGRTRQQQKWRRQKLAQTQEQLTIIQSQVLEAINSLERVEKTQEGITNRINQALKVSQKLETNTFESRVQLTNFRTKNQSLRSKVDLLKKYKGQLVELVTMF